MSKQQLAHREHVTGKQLAAINALPDPLPDELQAAKWN